MALDVVVANVVLDVPDAIFTRLSIDYLGMSDFRFFPDPNTMILTYGPPGLKVTLRRLPSLEERVAALEARLK